MKTLSILALCVFVGIAGKRISHLRHDHDQAEVKRKELARKVSEKGELTDELAGELRRLRVRVGRLEEKQSPSQP